MKYYLPTLLMSAQVEGSEFDIANSEFLRCLNAVSICARAILASDSVNERGNSLGWRVG